MITIKEDFVSFETAKLLKEKNCPDFGYSCICDSEGNKAQTQSIIMKWLREVHHYYIQVMLDSWAYDSYSGYYVLILKTDSELEFMLSDKIDKVFYDKPEEAIEVAIRYCLEYLI